MKNQCPTHRKIEQFPKRRVRGYGDRRFDREDEFLVRMDAVEFMRVFGFAVYEADSADDAIALLESHREIRAMFTDIHMPGSMDGLKLAHYVRGRWPPIKLIITSGHARPLLEDMPIGCEFVGKPYQLQEVADNLRSMTG